MTSARSCVSVVRNSSHESRVAASASRDLAEIVRIDGGSHMAEGRCGIVWLATIAWAFVPLKPKLLTPAMRCSLVHAVVSVGTVGARSRHAKGGVGRAG